MTGTIERVSPFGFMINGAWLNKGKNASDDEVNLKALGKGDEVEYDLVNNKFVTTVKVLKKSSKPAYTGGKSSSTNTEIARSTAVKAIFSGNLVTKLLEDSDTSEAISTAKNLIEEMAGYILTGKFEKNNE